MSEKGQPLARSKGTHRLARGTGELPSPSGQALERRAPFQSEKVAPRRAGLDATPGMRGQLTRPISPEVAFL